MSAKRHRVPGIHARRALFVLPVIADELDDATKDSLAVRNACAVEGRCPACGTAGELYTDATAEGLFHLAFRHEDWCPALTGEAA